MKASITRMFSTSLVPAMWLALMMLAINACSVSDAPQPVTLGSDECTACKMVISDGKFACEYITDKGRCYKFDDLSCMFNYLHKNGIDMSTILKLYVADYSNPQVMIDVKTANLVLGEEIHSPMNGGVAAFADRTQAEQMVAESHASLLDSWERLIKHH